MATESKYVVTVPDTSVLTDGLLGRKASLMVRLETVGLRIPETLFLLPDALAGAESNEQKLSEAVQQVRAAIGEIESATARSLGAQNDPLLLAMRFSESASAGRDSSAILNLGLPLSGTVRIQGVALSDASLELHRRRLSRFLHRARDLDEHPSASLLAADQRPAVLIALASFALASPTASGQNFVPSRSENSKRSAVIVQVMRPSALAPGEVTGTVFSRDPSGVVREPVGYFQVVCGAGDRQEFSAIASLRERMPEQYEALRECCRAGEELCGGVCRVRFGIERGTLYLLAVHRAAACAEVMGPLLVGHVREGRRTPTDALRAIDPSIVGHFGRPQLTNEASLLPLGRGVSLGSKPVCGRVAIEASAVETFAKEDEPVILVRENLMPEDAAALTRAEGIIAAKGGVASHMAVVAHGLGKACVAGIEGLSLLADGAGFRLGERVIRQGEWITVDETQGALFLGKGVFRHLAQSPEIEAILGWANAVRRVSVLVNATDVRETQMGLQAGADGIGLCRSEHHILAPPVLEAFRCMMLSDEDDQRAEFIDIVEAALAYRLVDLLRVLGGKPLHYRLLDVPVNEIMPADPESIAQIARTLNMEELEIQKRISALRETNSLLGCRGCRLGVTFPGLYRRQIKMAVKSAMQVALEGTPVDMTLVVPMVTLVSELEQCLSILRDEKTHTGLKEREEAVVRLGAMVETPRAALLSAELATSAGVLCFGTNDLTQATWAMSRDDTSAFFPLYRAQGLIDLDPFSAFDEHGVGRLVQIAITEARRVRADVQFYVCGEHAAEPRNIEWFIACGVDGVSCAADRVRSAIVAAAQATTPAAREVFPVTDRSNAQERAAHDMERIVTEVRRSHRAQAQLLAMDWAEEVSSRMELDRTDVWKYFKRNLVARWFGPREYRRFEPGWSTEHVLEYARTLQGRKVRYSLFPRTIACHAVSEVLPETESEREWRTRLEALDRSSAMEVFPQQPETDLCFRAVLQDFVLRVEAGMGQAMYVFEEERGHHPVVCGVLDARTLLVEVDGPQGGENPREYERIRAALRSLLDLFGIELWARCQDICRVVGVDWIAIEGYYDPNRREFPFVCDLDLPQDFAFHGS